MPTLILIAKIIGGVIAWAAGFVLLGKILELLGLFHNHKDD